MRSRIRAVAGIMVGCVLLGVLGGVVWGLLAPGEHLLVVDEEHGQVIAGESYHLFDAIGIFVCIAGVLGVWSAVAAWRWRSMRGPVQVAGLLTGSTLGAFAMALIGGLVAGWRFPHVDNPAVNTVVAHPPTLETPLPLLVQPLLGMMAILLLAALSSREDLGVDGDPADPTESADAADPAGLPG